MYQHPFGTCGGCRGCHKEDEENHECDNCGCGEKDCTCDKEGAEKKDEEVSSDE